MKKNFTFVVSLTALIVLTLVSCNKEADSNIEAVPFQETEDGQWGMISMDGTVLFKDEFKNMPTVVHDGRFFVKNKDGIWEMYDATEKPKRIGKDYVHATAFQNRHALVTEKGKPVSIIDTEGNTIKLLDKVDGKTIDRVSAFHDGYAVFLTTDTLAGVIDIEGNCIIHPKDYYVISNCGEGKFLAVERKYKKDFENGKKGKTKIKILNASGKELFSFNGDKYESLNEIFSNGKMAVSVKKDGKQAWGIINEKGEYVVKPMKKIENIGMIHGDKFTYNNGEGWGLMDVKCQTLIRAKYEGLFYDEDNLLVAVVKDGEDVKYKYIDENDNQIGKDTYVLATSFSSFDGNHALVKPDDKMYSIIDRDGNQIKGLPDMINVGFNDGDNYVESDFVDLQKVVADLNITANGALEFTFSSTVQDIVKAQVKAGDAAGDNTHPAGTPYWYNYSSDISFSKNFEGVNSNLNVAFSDNLSRETYRTKRVIDYEFYDEYWYHDEKIPTGYVWNAVHPTVFTITINNNGRMHGKLRDMLKALVTKFTTFGKIAKQNDGATVLTLNNGKTALICMSKDHVTATWGAIGNVNAINIDKYKDVVEGEADSSEDSGLNGLDAYSEAVAADTAIVDSSADWVEADSTAVDY